MQTSRFSCYIALYFRVLQESSHVLIYMCFKLSISPQWMDKEGNTPLSLACKKSKLYDVAQTLIQLGANVNAHPPGIFKIFLLKKDFS